MAGMGPAPKPADQRARRNKTVAMVRLPASGRTGRPPRWPLIGDIVTRARRDVWAGKVDALEYALEEKRAAGKPLSAVERRLDHAREQLAIYELRLAEQRKMEASLWRELWKLPQATQWEKLGWTRDVAQYVRHKVLGELGELEDAREARQWSDRLGLSPLAMMRLRWEVGPQAEQEQGGRQASGARARYGDLRVVSADAPSE